MADFLPSDAWREIFVRLPAKYVFRCRAVRKAWRSVIDDRGFVRSYIRKQLSYNTTNVVLRNSDSSPSHPLCSFDLNALASDGFFLQAIPVTPLDFNYGDKLHLPVAACEGLMLIPPEKPEHKWQIWNPSTHESLELPHGDFDSLKIVATGLGFDESTDDYKAVLIDSRAGRRPPGDLDEHVYRTHVYSLKSDSWRTIEDFPWHDVLDKGAISMKSMHSSCQHLIGVFMGGSLNWFFSPHQHKEMMIALDLGTETYRELKVPRLPDRPAPRVQERYLDVLDTGRLVLIDYEFDILATKVQNFDVWVMRDYEVEDSWTHLFSVEERHVTVKGRLPAISGDGIYGLRHVAFLNNKLQFCFQDRVGLYLFDVRTGTVKIARPIGHDQRIAQSAQSLETIVYAQVVPDSIFRLHENCGVGGRRRTNTKKRKGSKRKGQMMIPMVYPDDGKEKINMFLLPSEKWEIF